MTWSDFLHGRCLLLRLCSTNGLRASRLNRQRAPSHQPSVIGKSKQRLSSEESAWLTKDFYVAGGLPLLHRIRLAKPLTEQEQTNLWNEHHASRVGDQHQDEEPIAVIEGARYQISSSASRTTRQAVKEQFFMDHALCLDLGRDLIYGGFYDVEAITSKGSIYVRLA